MNREDVQIFIQARTNSTRFPNKVMAELGGRPIVEVLAEQASKVTKSVIVIPETEIDLRNWCASSGHLWAEGPEEDVLTRFYLAALEYKPEYILRLTADCPLITAGMINSYVELANPDFYQNNRRGFADGFDMELFSFGFLEYCYYVITDPKDREDCCYHWTKYREKKYSVDTEEEYKFVKEIYESRKIVK